MTQIDSQPEMKIKAIAPWFGGKRTLAPVIVSEFGKHSAYWEPFCGSMAILMAKEPCKMETVNDLHGDLINLARIIQGPESVVLYRRLRRAWMHEDFIADSKAALKEPFQPGIERAFHYFLTSWITRNGTAGTKESNQNFCRRYTSNGGHPATRLASAVDSIPAWRRRMRGICINRMDGLEMLERVEDKTGTVIYADPPYLKKNGEYLHDFDWLTHRKLAKILRRFIKTRVVVSYYQHHDLAELYPGWTIRETPITKGLASEAMRGKTGAVQAPEVLLINGPSYAGAS